MFSVQYIIKIYITFYVQVCTVQYTALFRQNNYPGAENVCFSF